jgi:hypothetical protein
MSFNPLDYIPTGLNLWALAAKALTVIAVAGLIFFGGYRYGTRDCVSANSPATVATAQHVQDVKQHDAAVAASGAAKTRDDKTAAGAAPHIQYIHDIKTVLVKVPANCPADPVMDPTVIDAYNKAGH